jgi:hypothetical protein
MNNISNALLTEAGNASFQPVKRPLAEVLTPLDELAAHSPHL